MAAPTVVVGVALGVPEDGDFIIGDATRGVIGSSDYLIASGYTTVTSDAFSVSVTRGRWSRLWDAVEAGSGAVSLWNYDRDFDPSNLAGPYAGYITPGRMVQVTANGLPVWTGFVDDWELSYDVSGVSTATLLSTDALGVLGQMQFGLWTSSGRSAQTKLAAICDRSEVAWSSAHRDFDEGVEALMSDSVTWGSAVLPYAQLVARSDLGYLFAATDGTLTFRNRNVASGVAPVVSFADDGSGGSIPFTGISATIGSEMLFARVGVDREGGTNQTATVADVATWQSHYGPIRSLSITGLLLNSDAQSLAMAEFLLSLYDTPRYRVSELVVDLTPLSGADQNLVLALDVTSVVEVTFTPNRTGDPIMQTLVVQGLRHDISPDRHTVTLSLIDAPIPFFRIGDADLGVIGEDIIGF